MSQHTATPPKRGRVLYTRYVVGTAKESPRLQSGVITELRLLQETGNLTKGEYKQVGELFEWLNQHLPVPPYSASDWPKDAISWFKPAAQGHLEKIEDIIVILSGYDLAVRTLRTFDPGTLHYEDEFQVVTSSPYF